MTVPAALVSAPFVLSDDDERPVAVEHMTVRELCELAGVAYRVTGGAELQVVLHAGTKHFWAPEAVYVGIGRCRRGRELRALEILAYGFHDYAARECVCGRGLFSVERRGRQPTGGRAMTAAERMRRMRVRRATAAALA